MKWQCVVQLSVKLLSDIAALLETEQIEDMLQFLIIIKDYVVKDEFIKLSEEEKLQQSYKILKNTLSLCNDKWLQFISCVCDKNVEEISLETAKNKLIQDYLNDINTGSDEIASMNINEWFLMNGFEIKQEKNISSSSVSE